MRAMIVLITFLACVGGCAGPGAALSRITGVWEAEDGSGDRVVIQPDGTFDFRETMLPMLGDVTELRRAGDSLERPQDGVRLEIVESDFTPTNSHIRMVGTRQLPEGGEEVGSMEFHARLAEGGRLAVRAGVLESPDSPNAAPPVRYYRRIGDAPPPPKRPPPPEPTTDKWILLGRQRFGGENWFEKLRVTELSSGALNSVLLTPKDETLAKRFLVVKLKATDAYYYESSVGSAAADAAKVGCSVLHIAMAELDLVTRPAPARVAELAQQVELMTQQAVDLLQPTTCGLETSSGAAYVGHYLWQKNNAFYDGWLCWNADAFMWYGDSPETARNKPVLFDTLLHNEHDVGRHEAVVAEYSAHGFENMHLQNIGALPIDSETGIPKLYRDGTSQHALRLLAEALGVEGITAWE